MPETVLYVGSVFRIFRAPMVLGLPGGSDGKGYTCNKMQETQVQSLSQEDPLEKAMATHSRILGWRIPMDRGGWQGYSPWGHKESDTTE